MQRSGKRKRGVSTAGTKGGGIYSQLLVAHFAATKGDPKGERAGKKSGRQGETEHPQSKSTAQTGRRSL